VKYVLVIVAIAGLAFTAITHSFWPWLLAVMGIGVALYLARNARLTTRVQLILVGALGGGLGAEIVRTVYSAVTGTADGGGQYRQVLIVALGGAIVVLGAMITEHLFRKLLTRKKP